MAATGDGVLGVGDEAEEVGEIAEVVGGENFGDGVPGGELDEAVDVGGEEVDVVGGAGGELEGAEAVEAAEVAADGAGGDVEFAGDLDLGAAAEVESADLFQAFWGGEGAVVVSVGGWRSLRTCDSG